MLKLRRVLTTLTALLMISTLAPLTPAVTAASASGRGLKRSTASSSVIWNLKPPFPAVAGLYASSPQALPFAPALDIRAFLEQQADEVESDLASALDADDPALEAGRTPHHLCCRRHRAEHAERCGESTVTGSTRGTAPADDVARNLADRVEIVVRLAVFRGLVLRRRTFDRELQVLAVGVINLGNAWTVIENAAK